MKRYFIFMAIILGMIAPSVSAQTAKQKIAVYVTGEAESGQKKVIGAKMVSSITRSDNYAAVERTADFLSALTQEQDYQMSGAVSDNQIVKLGQQFGVQYVLVADISEVYESMFISARMINVQTGQITGASEASGEVNSMDGLIELSDTVISELLGGITYGEYKANNKIEDIKVIGPFDTEFGLYNHYQKIPEGYHVASKEEIELLIKTYKQAKKHVTFPIYTDIVCRANDYSSFTAYYIDAILFNNADDYSEKSFSFDYDKDDREYEYNGSITYGYLYLIKNK
ncbi:hypothetical protein [uncultured Rikenella sp.]|uniref:hypothetical protein n=1 Tax=uncultured Rikenella sp. TaxID=368003 RepID=UPI00262A1463|nr:hypothetical protein [uncultured Rikenella sp.]